MTFDPPIDEGWDDIGDGGSNGAEGWGGGTPRRGDGGTKV